MLFRWFPLALLLMALTISGAHRKRAREGSETISRRRESGAFMAMRAAIALPIVLLVFFGAVSPGLVAWSTFPLPAWVRWFGVILGLACLPAVHWVLSSLGKNVSETVLTKKDHALVTIGPYQWIRHPLYTTGMTLFLALALMLANWLLLALLVIGFALILTVVIPAEERALLAKFGDNYRRLMARTGRMWPRISR